MELFHLIDRNLDTWYIQESLRESRLKFEFEYLPNNWFKETIKQITLETINTKKISLNTLKGYNNHLKTFFNFIIDYRLKTFASLNSQIAEEYLHYLLLNVKNPGTRSLKLFALKYFLEYGRILGWSGFPLNELFDGNEYKFLQSERTLKTMVIDDIVLKQIEVALDRMSSERMTLNQMLNWGLITVLKGTGMRTHEVLNIQECHIAKDLMGKPILEVLNDKTLTDRYIPISQEVVKAVRIVAKATKEIRGKLQTDFIFVYEHNKKYKFIKRHSVRNRVNTFVKKHNISDINGVSAHVTPHQFRHTIGTDLLNNGMSMREVMEYLGHNSVYSTSLYAKVQSSRFGKEYRKLGFIGVIEENSRNIVDNFNQKINNEKRLMAQLPDGICARPIKEQVTNCKKPNACLFCPKFITTPEFLVFHKDHLERIRADKSRYMEENLIGTDYLLEETEQALEDIITKLEKILNVRGAPK